MLRRDPDGAERIAPSWESLVERLIREAQEEGRFDDLPSHGEPLQLPEDLATGDLAMAHHLLRNAGVAPPWIEADKEVRALEDDIQRHVERATSAPPTAWARLSGRLDELVDQHDRAVTRLASLAPTPRQHRRRLDRAALRARFATGRARP